LLGAFGSKKSSGGTQTQETTRQPWEPAVPWLTNQITQGQNLQNYYQNNPFNQQQQTAYQNTFADIDNFRNNIAPGLFDKANLMMGSQYQRPSYSRPGMVGYTPGSGGGLLSQSGQAETFKMPQGGNYGLLSFAPQQAAPVPAASEPQPAAMNQSDIDARIKEALAGQYNYFSPFYNGGAGG
jgi:hypothetical protein